MQSAEVRASEVVDQSCHPACCSCGLTTRRPSACPTGPIPPAPTFTSFEGPVATRAGGASSTVLAGPGAPGIEVPLRADGGLSFPAEPPPPAHPRPRSHAPVSFTSAPLDADLVLVGHPSLPPPPSPSTPPTRTSTWSCSRSRPTAPPPGSTTGSWPRAIATPRHRAGAGAGGASGLDVGLPIRPAHHFRFAAGTRIRVQVSGGPPSKVTAAPEPVTTTFARRPTPCSACRGSPPIGDRRRLLDQRARILSQRLQGEARGAAV